MNRIFLRDVNNKKINPELVRYFKYQSDYYLIYTFHEIDEKDFMTLYVVKIMEELGQPIAKNLSNDWEWQMMQVVVKQMLREIKRNQIISFEDADIEAIQDVKVTSARSFKLLSSLVQILSGEHVEMPVPEVPQEEQIPLEIKQSAEEILTKEEQQNSLEIEQPAKEIGTKETKLITSDKIYILDQLKQKYQLQVQERKISTVNNSLNLSSIVPIQKEENMVVETIEDVCDILEIADEPMVDIDRYKKLRAENELLKQQLLQYQEKYQAIKDLLLKDE